MPTLSTYWHTLKYLKLVQIYGRGTFWLYQPTPDPRPAPKRRVPKDGWRKPAQRRASLFPQSKFNFLNEEHDLAQIGWDSDAVTKLWTYNLHYFDDLNAKGHETRASSHKSLMLRWIAENPPARGTGWEPYPTSLRIVNWIKSAIGGVEFPTGAIDSIGVQARWLARRIEWHLLGNHLYSNAKALVFAGAFFCGEEAKAWATRGVQILAEQTREQFLPDGGQFERSPMYHALALEDLLDLINLDRAFPDVLPPQLVGILWETAVRARKWLAAMTHPDGEISLFNDAAIGIAPSPQEIESYALRLGFAPLNSLRDGLVHLAETGYVRCQRGSMTVILDVGAVGPDYLPGHAHADSLSFEFSLAGRRMLVNSGTSQYGVGSERLRQRGTAAHNTVTVAGENSSEVWGGFRVARRARPFDLSIDETEKEMLVGCSHDGYLRLPGAPVHRRILRVGPAGMRVADRVIGGDGANCVSYWRAGHDVTILDAGPFRLARRGGPTLSFSTQGGTWTCTNTTLHPEFGLSLPAYMLMCNFAAGTSSEANLVWDLD